MHFRKLASLCLVALADFSANLLTDVFDYFFPPPRETDLVSPVVNLHWSLYILCFLSLGRISLKYSASSSSFFFPPFLCLSFSPCKNTCCAGSYARPAEQPAPLTPRAARGNWWDVGDSVCTVVGIFHTGQPLTLSPLSRKPNLQKNSQISHNWNSLQAAKARRG